MDSMLRTIHSVLETNLTLPASVNASKLKPFQLVKYVTGKRDNKGHEYTITNTGHWYGYDTIGIQGAKGFVRVALTPLFEII